MNSIRIVIECSKDLYTAYAENVKGLSGAGKTVKEAQKSILDCIEILKELKNTPKILEGEYTIIYKYDTQSFLQYYKGIFTTAALEKITGIDHSLINHYAKGLKRPPRTQINKIRKAINLLGSELLAIEL